MMYAGHSTRRLWWWVALALLPLLFARAVVPTGFMARLADGGIHYTFCGHDGATTPKHPGDTDRSCPFAQSAGAAPLPLLAIAPAPRPVARQTVAVVTSHPMPLSGPARQQRSRAPPPIALA
jgi:hypothetical protein